MLSFLSSKLRGTPWIGVILVVALGGSAIYGYLQVNDNPCLIPIAAGYGTKDIHVGMSCEDLSGTWIPHERSKDGKLGVLKSWMNFDKGLSVTCYKGKIWSIEYYLQETRQDDAHTFRAYLGRASGGLRAHSTPQEVVNIYGGGADSGENLLSKKRFLNYQDEGISFIFNHAGLTRVIIRDRSVDHESIRADIRTASSDDM